MSGLYLDAYSGISGDMLLSALLDVGVPLSALLDEVEKLELPGWRLDSEAVTRHGISGTRAHVTLEDTRQPTRHLSDIERLLVEAPLEPRVRAGALGVFSLLARAEAKVHGVSQEEVHFHEVGAVDAVVDIVGACAGLCYLGVERFTCSPLPLGDGYIQSAHGMLPVPAPATLELLTGCGASILPGKGEGEMVTPTGAALVAHFGRFDVSAAIQAERVGYGFGTRELRWPNALRAVLTRDGLLAGYETDEVVVLECNIDDMAGEVYPFVIERLLERGALDAWTVPISMKKGRPAVLLSVLATAGTEGPLVETLLRETTTLGIRYAPWSRYKAGREGRVVSTVYGEISVKLKMLREGVVEASPEYEDCARRARESGAPLRRVYEAATRAAWELIEEDKV